MVEQILSIDADRRKTQAELDALNAEANTLAKQVGDLFKQGKKAEADDLKNKSGAIKESSKKLDDTLKNIEAELQNILVLLPNLPQKSVPKGKTAAENEIVHSSGEGKVVLPKNSLPHWELAHKYKIIDFELGVKLTGAGFPVYMGKGAQLQRALINFFLDKARD